MNFMREVAKILDVEWATDEDASEKFGIVDSVHYYRLKEQGLMTGGSVCNADLIGLLRGDARIRKAPWEPKRGEIYYYPSISSTSGYDSYSWDNDTFDNRIRMCGLICRTKEEAKAKTDKILALLKEGKI